MVEDPALRYYPDKRPGISRKRQGNGFEYFAPDGTSIEASKERQRLDGMAIPPAYTGVWMSPVENGHLWATGRDARDRKQYRYHPKWRQFRQASKFETLADFAKNLPRIRGWIARNLSADAGSQDAAIAIVLALIDRASLRTGTADYARENQTYGATTLLEEHVSFKDGITHIRYRGKGGKRVKKNLSGQRLQKAMHRAADLPGADLAVWQDDAGNIRQIRSEHINEKISELSENTGTAKSFRTWNGTLAAFRQVTAKPDTPTIKAMSEAAAEALHNTPSIARNNYIHPRVIDLVNAGSATLAAFQDQKTWAGDDQWRAGEAPLIEFL